LSAYSLERDLDEILEVARDDIMHFAGSRLYVAGGTGFFGTWLLQTIAHANRRLRSNISLDILTRDPSRYIERHPGLSHEPGFTLVAGDILKPESTGVYDGIIHAATPATTNYPADDIFANVVDGARALIDSVIKASGSVPVFFTSTGGVYGRQPIELERIPETYMGAPDQLDPAFTYHEAKRAAELLFSIAQSKNCGLLRLGRLFAFIGPGLPLDAHFAAGNFLGDALRGRPIRVTGDGTPMRSYLYPTDMITWCLAIFARGTNGRAYNVGSDAHVSIRSLADRIDDAARLGISPEREQAQHANVAGRYVPDASRIKSELGVQITVGIDEAIRRTISSHRVP
jgi:dTDP-glucose 4,6-dehydratase